MIQLTDFKLQEYEEKRRGVLVISREQIIEYPVIVKDILASMFIWDAKHSLFNETIEYFGYHKSFEVCMDGSRDKKHRLLITEHKDESTFTKHVNVSVEFTDILLKYTVPNEINILDEPVTKLTMGDIKKAIGFKEPLTGKRDI